MPKVARWYIKTALGYFVAALTLGVLLALPAPALAQIRLKLPAGLLPVYIHLLAVGWLTQLIFGVALWMFPKYSRQYPRGSERLAWAAFALLNGGLVLRAIGEPLAAAGRGGWLLAVSALAQWAAAAAFLLNTWPRVKEK